MASTVFAAVAFAAASLGAKYLEPDHNNYKKEMKRHNKALEDLSKAKEAFYENEVKQHDRIQEYQRELDNANDDIEGTNKALDMLTKLRRFQYGGRYFDREPRLDDFYKPSKTIKEYQYIFTFAAAGATGLGLYGLKKLIF